VDLEPVDTFVAEIGHFADSLLDKTRPPHTEEVGIAVLVSRDTSGVSGK
jgi:hypothetical protein